MSRSLAVPCAVLALMLSTAICQAADPLAPVTRTGNPTEKRLSALASRYFRGYYAFAPGWATNSGLHQYDSLLTDLSRPAIDREIERTRNALEETRKIDASKLSDSARVDYDLFQRGVEGHLFDLTEIRGWENDPGTYNYGNAIFALVARNYAPPEQRLRMVTARLRQVPRLLESGEQNVKNPPEMFARFGAEDLGGTIEFLDKEVPPAFSSVKDAALWKRYEDAKATAVAATRQYIDWIQKELVPTGPMCSARSATGRSSTTTRWWTCRSTPCWSSGTRS